MVTHGIRYVLVSCAVDEPDPQDPPVWVQVLFDRPEFDHADRPPVPAQRGVLVLRASCLLRAAHVHGLALLAQAALAGLPFDGLPADDLR